MDLYGLLIVIVVGTSIWVAFDAPAHGLSRTWALGCLALWIVAFPWYLSVRGRPPRTVPTHGRWETDPRDDSKERWREGTLWTRQIRDKSP